jgi:hypothetical protein
MSTSQILNTKISVTASIDQTGLTRPRTILLHGQTLTVIAVGRQWEETEGRYVLVEVGDGTRYELLLSRQDLTWRIKRAWPISLAA